MVEKKKTRRPRAKGKRIHVRPLRLADYEAVCALQLRCFPGMKTWGREQFESMLSIFPEGQICVEVDGKLVASSSSLIVDFDLYSEWHNWAEMSDNGYIRNHDPKGDTLYGIEIMVDPDSRGYRLSRRLYDERKRIAREKNLARIIIGGRIPGYHVHAPEMRAEDYVEQVVGKALYDQVLTAQLANGFVLRQLIPGYLPSDHESMGYATFLEWTNFDYQPAERRHFRAVEIVRLAVVQYQMRPIQSFDDFATQCAYFVDVAADSNSDFVVFPELFSTQLLSLTPGLRPGLAARKLADFTAEYVEMFNRLAIKHNINIIGGSHFSVEEDDRLYNISYLFHRDGRISKQYKIHITPSERRWWGVSPGNEINVFDTDCGKVAILICYDVEFPEVARIAAKKGAHILFVPYNTDDRYGHLRVRWCAQARCIENHVFAVIAGCTGNLPFVDNADVHYAQSAIFTPSDVSFSRDGVAAECTPNTETVLVHDVDIELLRRHRYMGTTLNWSDRRRDVYQVRYTEGGEQKEV